MGRQPSGKTPQRPRSSQWEQALLVCEKGQGTAQESLMLLARLDDLGVANAPWADAGVANAPAVQCIGVATAAWAHSQLGSVGPKVAVSRAAGHRDPNAATTWPRDA